MASTLLLFGLQVIQKPSKSIHMEWVHVIQIDAHTHFWACTEVYSDGLSQIPAIIEVRYNYIHNNCLPIILQQFN